MFYIKALFIGALTALAAILLHQSLPPVGLMAGLALSYSAIWYVGREFGKKRYKVAAAFAWILIVLRATWPGIGFEILIISDGVGYGAIFLGIPTVLIAALRRI